MRVIEGLVGTEYHLAVVATEANRHVYSERGVPADPARTGLINGSGPMLWLQTGVGYGAIPFRIEVHDAEPPLDLTGWEDVAESSVEMDADPLVFIDSWGVREQLDVVLDSGVYRTRVFATGRDVENDHSVEVAAEERFLVQLWPAPPAPPHSIQVRSQVGMSSAASARTLDEEWVDPDPQGTLERENIRNARLGTSSSDTVVEMVINRVGWSAEPTIRIRSIPDTLDPHVVAEIDTRLADLEGTEGVNIAWAIESGSRAWGFPSPDSDYDCRFVYIRSFDDYLTPWPPRDVLETPLDEVFDVNGWDLVKAVRLLVRGNATVVEWLRSPIVYTGDPTFRDALLDLARDVIDPALVANHYLHVGRQQWGDGADVPLKRVFYALRPTLSLRWMRLHRGDGVPPMTLQQLLAESDPPEAIARAAHELVELKAVTRELGTGRVDPALLDFVRTALAAADEVAPDHSLVAERRQRASEWFRGAAARWGSSNRS